MRVIDIVENITILAPSTNDDVPIDKGGVGQKLITYIHDNCSDWLSQSGGEVVYRGMTPPAGRPYAFIKDVRMDRKPKDSHLNIHNMYNKIIAAAGKSANRSNAVFVTANAGEAEGYGHPYVVFPIGPFHYTWHELFTDWQVSERNVLNTHYMLDDDEDSEIPIINKRKLKHIKGDDGTLPTAISMEHEIMIQCKHYVAVDIVFYAWYLKGKL